MIALWVSNTGGMGLILGQETRILPACMIWPKKKKKSQLKNYAQVGVFVFVFLVAHHKSEILRIQNFLGLTSGWAKVSF